MRLPDNVDLDQEQMAILRRIVRASFVSTGSVPVIYRKKLLDLGLVSHGMGGLMPTPAGKIMARM